MKDWRQHCIGYVASMMWEAFGVGIWSFDEVARDYRAVNDREGFEVDYISPGMPPGHWLRIEGVRLTPEEMDEAISRAKRLVEEN